MSLEKAKLSLSKEIEEMTSRVDQANVLYSHAEKKIKQMDKVIGEWKIKADGISMELNNSQKECRNASAELFRVKNGYEEANVQFDDVRRENKALSDEIKVNTLWTLFLPLLKPEFCFCDAAKGKEN